MDRDMLVTHMKGLKAKAKAARKAGNKVAAAAFKNGASRLQRRIKGMPAPPAPKTA